MRNLSRQSRVPARLIGGLRRWRSILAQVWGELRRDNVSMMAAGVAFYALLAIFPGMSALISIFGLVADPVVIEQRVAELRGVLPEEALRLLSGQLHALVTAPPAKLGLGLFVSLVVAMWSAINGTGMLMQTLTVAYNERDERSLVHFYGVALALTVMLNLFGLVSLFLVAVVPAALALLPAWLPVPLGWLDQIALIRWPILAAFVIIGLGILYRFAPCRRMPHWQLFGTGTIGAALLWLAASAGFSLYVARFASYDRMYGSLGAVVILLVWLYLSAYIVLAGAELNVALETHHGRRHPRAGAAEAHRAASRAPTQRR